MRIIKFHAPWCGQCVVLEKNLQRTGLKYESINADEHEDMAARYGVRNIPAIVVVDDDDHVVKRLLGIISVDKLKEELQDV